ncbi:MAG: hypothetical protein LOD90_08170 [Symbiobacteriaceae bacterium]
MARVYYRLILTVLCALAAYVTPAYTLKYPYHLPYFGGGLVAALLAWSFLRMAILLEPEVKPGIQFIVGAGFAVVSWAHISMVAVLIILPQVIRAGRLLDTFDPIWILGGLSPLCVPAAAVALRLLGRPFLPSLASAFFRFSVPLGFLSLIPRWLHLPKQFRWLFLFTGVMFLVLDGLGYDFRPRRRGEPL